MINFATKPRLRMQCFIAFMAFFLGTPAHADSDDNNKPSLEVHVKGFRTDKGIARVALCRPNTGFPKCDSAEGRSASVPIVDGVALVRFSNLQAGDYAVSVFHDANANGALDTLAGIPREGYGFSQNPAFRPRAPHFSEARINVRGAEQIVISLRYIL